MLSHWSLFHFSLLRASGTAVDFLFGTAFFQLTESWKHLVFCIGVAMTSIEVLNEVAPCKYFLAQLALNLEVVRPSRGVSTGNEKFFSVNGYLRVESLPVKIILTATKQRAGLLAELSDYSGEAVVMSP